MCSVIWLILFTIVALERKGCFLAMLTGPPYSLTSLPYFALPIELTNKENIPWNPRVWTWSKRCSTVESQVQKISETVHRLLPSTLYCFHTYALTTRTTHKPKHWKWRTLCTPPSFPSMLRMREDEHMNDFGPHWFLSFFHNSDCSESLWSIWPQRCLTLSTFDNNHRQQWQKEQIFSIQYVQIMMEDLVKKERCAAVVRMLIGWCYIHAKRD